LAERESGTVIRVVVKSRASTPPDLEAVRKLFEATPGVRSVNPADGEGGSTLGFRVLTAGQDDPREALFSTAVSNQLVLLDLHREHISL
ncbi:MAG TPA: ABC transporter, partial [Myxococcales bacterium]|nr:ABC transporter [Myxococcales bacterium]